MTDPNADALSEAESQRDFFSAEQPGRKGEILDAAATVFAENGYTGGSMRQIAGRVGVSEPALYRHFPSKDAIFISLIRVGTGRLRGEALALISRIEPDDLRAQLVAVIVDRRRALQRYNVVLRAIMPAAMRNPAFLDEIRVSMVDPLRAALTEKTAELDQAFGEPLNAEESREARVRALIALFVGSLISSTVLRDEPDAAVADAALRVMGWDRAGR